MMSFWTIVIVSFVAIYYFNKYRAYKQLYVEKIKEIARIKGKIAFPNEKLKDIDPHMFI